MAPHSPPQNRGLRSRSHLCCEHCLPQAPELGLLSVQALAYPEAQTWNACLPTAHLMTLSEAPAPWRLSPCLSTSPPPTPHPHTLKLTLALWLLHLALHPGPPNTALCSPLPDHPGGWDRRGQWVPCARIFVWVTSHGRHVSQLMSTGTELRGSVARGRAGQKSYLVQAVDVSPATSLSAPAAQGGV